MSSRQLPRLFCVLILATYGLVASAEHSWSSYHWARTANPFTLKVVDSTTTEWFVELDETLTRWSASTVLNLEITGTDTSRQARKRCGMVKGQIRVCNDSYGNNGWLGLASIGIDNNGHIDRGTAKVNDFYSSYWVDPAEKNHVMCQEVGHLFGLGHTSEDGSSQATCMDYSSDPNSQWPNAHDFEQLLINYAGTDSYNSYDGPADSGGGECNAPPGKGCNKGSNLPEIPPMGLRINKGNNHEVWVAPRNDGGLWIHHIRLVPSN